MPKVFLTLKSFIEYCVAVAKQTRNEDVIENVYLGVINIDVTFRKDGTFSTNK